MRRGLAIPFLAALLLVPAASAGSASDPELRDPKDKTQASADLLAGWFSDHPDGVRFTLQVASVQPRTILHVYYVGFVVSGQRVQAGIGFDTNGALRTSLNTPSGWGGPGYAATVDDALLEPSFQPGAPATFSAVIPWGAVSRLQEGAEARSPSMGTTYFASGRWQLEYDSATSSRAFVAGGADDASTWSWVLLPGGAGAGALAGFLLGRRVEVAA